MRTYLRTYLRTYIRICLECALHLGVQQGTWSGKRPQMMGLCQGLNGLTSAKITGEARPSTYGAGIRECMRRPRTSCLPDGMPYEDEEHMLRTMILRGGLLL